jgi:polysaccharide biosynthesis/export protein
MTRTLVLLSLLTLLAVQAALVGAEEATPPPATYRIGAGDVLEISVWKNEQLSRTVTVRPDGMISLPLLNDVQAAGSTPLQLRDTLAKKLAEYVPAAEVSVIVNRVRSFSVSVIGSVTKPGHFNLSGPTTVLDALAMAGGVTEFASRKSIFVVRAEPNGTKRLPFNYNKAISENDEGENFLLQAGDVVVVP